MLAERLLIDIYSSAQEYVGGANALDGHQLLLYHIHAAADVKEIPSSVVSICNQVRLLCQTRFDVTPTKLFYRLEHLRSRCHWSLPYLHVPRCVSCAG
jgi:hypothetical protein